MAIHRIFAGALNLKLRKSVSNSCYEDLNFLSKDYCNRNIYIGMVMVSKGMFDFGVIYSFMVLQKA